MSKRSNNNRRLRHALFLSTAISFAPLLFCAQAHAENGQGDNLDAPNYMLQLVNNDRRKAGSPPVSADAKLDHVAQVYADYLLKTGFFGHVDPFGRNPQDRANLFGINASVAENLAWESSNFEGPGVLIERAEESMMAEPPNQMNHRYNILNPKSKYVGIGVARAGDKILMVQEYTEDKP